MAGALGGQALTVVLLVGPHDELSPETDVYARLYRTLGIEAPDAERRKPPCCVEEEPPIDPDFVDRFIERSRELAREERRRSSSTKPSR